VFILPIIKGIEEGSGEASPDELVEATKKYHPFVTEITAEENIDVMLERSNSISLPPNSILLTLGADSVRRIGEQFLKI